MKKSTIVWVALASVILVPFIAMNATIISSGAKNEIPEGDGGRLSVQIHTNGAEKVEAVWTDLINDFMDETDIQVKTYKGVMVNTQLKTQWDSDNPPDFVFVDGNGLSDAAMVKDGKFLALDEWWASATISEEDRTKLSALVDPKLITQYRDGKMYTIPILKEANGAFYDKTFIEENGFHVPHNSTELLSSAEEFKAKGVAPLTYPGQYAPYLLWAYIMPSYAAYEDTAFFDAVCSAKDPTIYRDPRFREVLERYASFVSAGNLLNDTINYSHSQSQAAWINHDAAAISNGLWLEGEIASSLAAKPAFKMMFTNSPLILDTQKETSVFTPKTIAIASKGKSQENALRFAAYLLREDNQERLVEAYGYLSSHRDFEYEGLDLTDCAKQAFATLQGAENIVYHRYDWGTVGDIFNTVINGIGDGTCTVDAGIERIINEANKQ